MAEDDDCYREQELIGPLDPNLSIVVIRESSISSKDDLVVFPPMNHENLVVASSIFDSYLESPSESESPSSSSRRSGSSSSFSLLPSDSDGQLPLNTCEFDPKSPSETEAKSPPSDSVCEFDRKSQLCETKVVVQDWWEILLVRVYSKLKSLVTWFSTNLLSLYPVLAIAIWWWMRVRARRRRINGETMNSLRDTIKERDERIVKLLNQIAQMNELLVKHHKDIVS